MSASHDNAPHSGTWIQTDAGFVEISVFETGVPPHFRLYFFDAGKQPVAPLRDMIAMLKTIRPEGVGAEQVFSFTDEGSYLQSTSDIPEPHEFEVVFTLVQQGNGTTEFILHEVFSGPMLALIGGSLPDMTEPFKGFVAGEQM